MNNDDVNKWRAWFDIHGFTEERADMRMLLSCAAAMQCKDALTMASDFVKARSVETGSELSDDEKIMAMFKRMG